MVRAKLVAVAGAAAIASINIWTGAPLLALWLGSHVAPSRGLSFAAVVCVVVGLAAMETILLGVLSRLNQMYARLTGAPLERRRSTWLLSLGDGESRYSPSQQSLTVIERILAVNVAVAGVIFEIWFFFFAQMPAPG
jgi:hypothetical protein